MNIHYQNDIPASHSRVYDMAIVLLIFLLHIFLLSYLFWLWSEQPKKNLDKLQFELVELPDYIRKEDKVVFSREHIKGGGSPVKLGKLKLIGSSSLVSVITPEQKPANLISRSVNNPVVKKADSQVDKTVAKTASLESKSVVEPAREKEIVISSNQEKLITLIKEDKSDFELPKAQERNIAPIEKTTIHEKDIAPLEQPTRKKQVEERVIESTNNSQHKKESVPTTKVAKSIEEVAGKIEKTNKTIEKIKTIEPVKTQKIEQTIPIVSHREYKDSDSNSQVKSKNISPLANNRGESNTKMASKGNAQGNNAHTEMGKGTGSSQKIMGVNSGGTGNRSGMGGNGKGLGFQKGIRQLVGKKIYPTEARKNNLVGDVQVSVEVNEKGVVEKAIILKSSGSPILDKAALETARTKYKYVPDKNNGIPERTKFRYTISYKLTDY